MMINNNKKERKEEGRKENRVCDVKAGITLNSRHNPTKAADPVSKN